MKRMMQCSEKCEEQSAECMCLHSEPHYEIATCRCIPNNCSCPPCDVVVDRSFSWCMFIIGVAFFANVLIAWYILKN